jgi:dUTP pyrophosphatase
LAEPPNSGGAGVDGAGAGIELPIKRLRPEAVIPARAYSGDAGLDLSSCERVELGPGQRALVPTGLAVAIPDGHAGYVQPRSGLAVKHGISMVNTPGLIDSGYRGEVRVLLLNTDPREPFEVTVGDRIAQLLLVRHEAPEVLEVESLDETVRGAGGFGSSGR